MEKYTRVEGVAASFPRPNIDTDAIISVAWQRSLKSNPGEGLFAIWRYDLQGQEVPDFILNRAPFRKSKVIVAGANFGCGSSREFAVWALVRFGIRCVIAPTFGDIFYENSFKNGLLLVTLPQAEVDEIHHHLATTNDPTMSVDLESCTIELPNDRTIAFNIPTARRATLLEGLDEIGQTLRFVADIEDFQQKSRACQPWLYARPEPRHSP
ncbi:MULTISPECIES: 3-isopropylmalate dehydratase small subunit [Bradyrhizobium]|uniref:3-isopropylmalate dehydratase n=3 Tax=Bradyrhizobium TaxID=374 RepID=A0A410VI74_9BRAD|nr:MULTISPECIES: 3-isopropylmalate dehydratase small subunit [Bradyrhizobium]MCG2628252.1 3-isopropylmalate dehydratase small subunit [Bradyrhizobium zhengyangense]MCG2643371.1 3-isopropylmalate dehydratase small subunit [Bradyrhizobium zhengyangense]MCG2670315.1 3-isopropylmalate dehydratase small subunit [Bradyrhizobium zhengyangense]MDN4985951.1 3-isopropylmalate dehydratase small subunit [Bradyrhizobium sp. WYCCWR 13022]MDN5002669.1 3-isopropylmalate dehydratase small subunit [Bradyrhizobi